MEPPPPKRQKREDSSQPESPELPSEIWVEVFSKLPGRQLKRVRLVCRQWRDLVGSFAATMDKLRLTIPASRPSDCSQNLNTLARSFSRCSKIKIVNLRQEEMVTLRPLMGKNLQELNLHKCWMPARELVGLLTSLPSLKSLKFSIDHDFNYQLHHIEAIQDRALPGIEELSLDLGNQDEFLDLFGGISTQVRILKLNLEVRRYHEEEFGAGLVRYVGRMRNTLKEFYFKDGDDMPLVKRILSLNGLQLNALEVGVWIDEDEHIIEFCRLQPSLEKLLLDQGIVIINQEVFNALSSLPNLKTLSLTAANSLHLTSDTLTTLSLFFNEESFDLQELNLPNLKNLTINIESLDSLQQVVQKFQNLHQLALAHIEYLTTHDIFVTTSRLRHLRSLSLNAYGSPSEGDSHFYNHSFRPVWTLTELHLRGPFCWQSLATSVRKFPRLRRFSLSWACIRDDDMAPLCQALKETTEIRFAYCHMLSGESIAFIDKHCHALELLTIEQCRRIPAAAIEQLRAGGVRDVVFK